MKIMKLTSMTIAAAVAVVHANKSKNRRYFNIRHGSSGKDLWVYVCGLDVNYFSPKNTSDALTLDADNYILTPVIRRKEPVKDIKDNVIYNITIDNMIHHKKDYLVFWEIPNKNYTTVTYTINGKCSEIGKGITGKERNDKIYSSPAPVLEIYGSCSLYWEGIDEAGNKDFQTITYNYDENRWVVDNVVSSSGETASIALPDKE